MVHYFKLNCKNYNTFCNYNTDCKNYNTYCKHYNAFCNNYNLNYEHYITFSNSFYYFIYLKSFGNYFRSPKILNFFRLKKKTKSSFSQKESDKN